MFGWELGCQQRGGALLVGLRLHGQHDAPGREPCPELSQLSFPHSSANKCLLKVATYAAQLEQYQKAVEIYEQVCASCPTAVSGEHPPTEVPK